MRTTEQGQPHVHPQWSAWEQRHLLLCLHWQSLGMPCQRKETASYSWLEHSSPSIVLAEISSFQMQNCTELHTFYCCFYVHVFIQKLNKLFILFFKPLDPLLWDCEHRHARLSHCPQGFSVEKINTDDWEYKYMNKTC